MGIHRELKRKRRPFSTRAHNSGPYYFIDCRVRGVKFCKEDGGEKKYSTIIKEKTKAKETTKARQIPGVNKY